MADINESGQDIELAGTTGVYYRGKIYADENCASALSGKAIAVLSNSTKTDTDWHHSVNSIYNTENIAEEMAKFQHRDDISHLILLPYNQNEGGVTDKVDDIIRNYIHK